MLLDKRIRYIVSDKANTSYQRNVGLSVAKDEFIIFIDSDDYISLQYFDISDALIEKNIDADLIVFNLTPMCGFLNYNLDNINYRTTSDHNEIFRCTLVKQIDTICHQIQ